MRKKSRSFYKILIIVLMLCVTIGYAALNSTLNINGKSKIRKSTWDLYFDNVNIMDGSVEAVKVPTASNSTNVDFEVNLGLPGDFYVFTVDIVNNGTIDAMIENIEKTPDLTLEQQKYLNYIVEYENGEQFTTKQLVNAGEFVRVKVIVEYKSDITASDLPENNETLNLGFTLNYVQADNSGVRVNDNGASGVIAYGDLDEFGTIVTIGDQQFYSLGTEGDNVKLLAMYNLHVGNEVTHINLDTEKFQINEIKNPTGMQSSKAKGLVATINSSTEDFEFIFPWVGVTEFSNDEYHGEEYNQYEGSLVEKYVNNYKDLLESKFDVEIDDARLFLTDDLLKFSPVCIYNNNFNEFIACINNNLPWIFSTAYWINSSDSSDGVNIFGSIGDIGVVDMEPYYVDFSIGVRPVIVIKKSDIAILEN